MNKVIKKEITDSYSFRGKVCLFWKETIETDQSDYEELEPIYPYEKGCGNEYPHHPLVPYRDKEGRERLNCCFEPKWVKYRYYLTDWQPNEIKIKVLHLPVDNKNINFSQFLLIEHDYWNKQIRWLGNLLTNEKLFFENKEIEKAFIQEYNNYIQNTHILWNSNPIT